MRNITVLVDYATVSPIVLEQIIGNDLMGWCGYRDVNEDYFEFWVECREEDAAAIERKLAKYL